MGLEKLFQGPKSVSEFSCNCASFEFLCISWEYSSLLPTVYHHRRDRFHFSFQFVVEKMLSETKPESNVYIITWFYLFTCIFSWASKYSICLYQYEQTRKLNLVFSSCFSSLHRNQINISKRPIQKRIKRISA